MTKTETKGREHYKAGVLADARKNTAKGTWVGTPMNHFPLIAKGEWDPISELVRDGLAEIVSVDSVALSSGKPRTLRYLVAK